MASHVDGPATVQPPETIYRIARSDGILRFSTITPQDALLPDAGNRFDVVGGGVLYGATERRTCFAETLARYRVPPEVRAVVNAMDDGIGRYMACAGVPADWRARRVVATLRLSDPLPFVDANDLRTHEHLSTMLAADLVDDGGDLIDGSDVRGAGRRLTRAISRWAFSESDETGAPLYSGIRYKSRLTDEECWAVFDGTDVEEVAQEVIDLSDPDLTKIALSFGLRMF